jgi:hypothetical protein
VHLTTVLSLFSILVYILIMILGCALS